MSRRGKSSRRGAVTVVEKPSQQRASMADVQAAAALATRWVRAKYDAAQNTDEFRKHFAMADGLSANAAASPGVRRILRNRTRYECDNNSYCRGAANSLANDTIGTGPRLQMTGMDRETGGFVERQFTEWMRASSFAEKLRTMRRARAVDGEAFAIFINNPLLPTRVKLDLRLVEAEQIATPWGVTPAENEIDGIKYDVWGNPFSYDMLPVHPGSGMGIGCMKPVPIPASQVIHLFLVDRPGQRRGIPELTPALPLFAQLRRWTLAVLAAAETAADLAAILKTQDSASPEEAAKADSFERVEFERRALMTLPAGWEIQQLKAEHPSSTYGEVKREILGEAGSTIHMPYNVIACNSSGYNYSSGRLDFQKYHAAITVDRSRFDGQCCDRVFAAWYREAVLIEGYLPQAARMVSTDWSHVWHWPGFAFIDPESEANAQETRLKNKTTTLAAEYARDGKDWEEQMEQIAKEKKKQKDLEAKYGITFDEVPPAAGGQVNVARDRQVLPPAPAPAPAPQGAA